MPSKKQIVIDIGTPNPKQEMVLTDTHKIIGFGGARGGGKSWVVRTKAKLLAVQYPGIKILIVRCTYTELLNNHINPLRDELNGIARYNSTEKMFRFRNGSSIKFGYCSADKDLGQYQGAEYDIIFLDEATNLQELWIKKIMACLRGTNGLPKRMYMTMNPGGPGHNFVKRIFIDRRFEDGENPDDYSFVQSLVTDNMVLMEQQPDYIKQLEALPPKLREAWLYGRWDIFEGQFFEDFRETPDPAKAAEEGCTVEDLLHQRRWTHVIEPFKPDPGWTVVRAYDFGYAKPFSLSWNFIDYDGTIYRALELYGCTQTPNEGVKWTPERQFEEAARIEREHPWLKGKHITGVADPSIWDPSRGISTAEVAAGKGILFTPGDNARIDGWMQCHYRLQFSSDGYPRYYVFNNCRGFIRTIPGLMYSETKPEDLDTDGEDHIADEWRYLCMSRPVRPILPDEPETLFTSDPLNMIDRNDRRKILTQVRFGG